MTSYSELYNELLTKRTLLVNYYKENGTIRYDIATGLAYYNSKNEIEQRVKYVKQFYENGDLITDINGKPILKKVIDFEEVARFNKSEGVESGSMIDALRLRATGKVVQLYNDDQCLRWGMVLLEDVKCLLQIMENINLLPVDIFPIFQTSEDNDNYPHNESSEGLVHSLENKVETFSLLERGKYKSYNYRGDAELLTNPISIWSQSDISRLSTSIFGINSLIRMWGDGQVLDLNGYELNIIENTNIFSGFSSIITMADGAFDGLSTRGCTNSFIYNSNELIPARLARSNHFAISGHKCNNILIEGFLVGDVTTKNKAPYFAAAIFNESSNIIFKDITHELLSHNVTRSSLGLNWYADLTMSEILFGKFIRPVDWTIYSSVYLWLKWEDIDSGEEDKYGNGKKTVYPVVKSVKELSITIGEDNAVKVYEYLREALAAYYASMKCADDHSIQIDIYHNRNAEPLIDDRLENGAQVSRTTNLSVANSLNREEMNMYPPSTTYGFRAGTVEKGTFNLAQVQAEVPVENIFVVNCSFNEHALSPIESVSILGYNGLFHSFNDLGLRPFGYSNHRNPSAGVAASTMLLSSKYLSNLFHSSEAQFLAPGSLPYVIPVPDNDTEYALDTANIAFKNAPIDVKDSWKSSINVNGLYKGNDILEHSLSLVTAFGILQKNFPESSFFLNGLNNSNLDIGILAWRKTMMNAINASTASNIGLNGGYLGDISDYNPGQSTVNTTFNGEIYPWFSSKKFSSKVKYDVLIEKREKKTHVTFLNKLHSLKIGEKVLIEKSELKEIAKVLKLISSTEVIITQIDDDFINQENTVLIQRLTYKIPKKIIDKDSDYFNTEDKIEHKRETVKYPYIGTTIPQKSHDLFKFDLKLINESRPEDGVLMYLVHSDTNTPVTYRECAEIVGFETIGTYVIPNLDTEVLYCVAENLDPQNHVMKGSFGVRLDQVNNGGVINSNVNNIEGAGFCQEVNIIGSGKILIENDILQVNRPGSHVNDFHGISINGCSNIEINNFNIDSVSILGNIYGTEVYGQSSNVNINNVYVSNIKSGAIYSGISEIEDPFHLSNKIYYYKSFPPQDAIGVNISKDCTNINLNNIEAYNIISPAEYNALKIRISEEASL